MMRRMAVTSSSVVGAILAMVMLAIYSSQAVADDESIRLAIKGYDPVAYFTDGRPTKGKSKYSYTWQNVRYRFANAAHRDEFAANPERFAPQFAGYCALGMAKGVKFEVDPEAWTIVNGKLYLNSSQKFRDQWRADEAANIAKAEANWKSVEH